MASVRTCGVDLCNGNNPNGASSVWFPGMFRYDVSLIVRMLASKCAMNAAPAGQYDWRSGGFVLNPLNSTWVNQNDPNCCKKIIDGGCPSTCNAGAQNIYYGDNGVINGHPQGLGNKIGSDFVIQISRV